MSEASFDYEDFTKRGSELRCKIEVAEERIAQSENTEVLAYNRSCLKHSWPRAETFSPDWDKRELVHFFEDLTFEGVEEGIFEGLDYSPEFVRFSKLPEKNRTICESTFEHRTCNAKPLFDNNEVTTKATFFWTTELHYEHTEVFRAWKENQEELRVTTLAKHFESCNWFFPLLLGSQHNNRFKRDTKVYVLSGPHKGKHGTVVGHGTNFELKRWGSQEFLDNRSPLLKVLLFSPTLDKLEVHDIRQDTVKLIDLHKKLNFALPSSRPSKIVKEYGDPRKKRRKEIPLSQE